MNILLVSPRFPGGTFWSFDRALRLSGRRATMPPLGLLTVAGSIPVDRHSVSLADESVRPVTDGELSGADVVLLSAMIVQREALEVLVDRCRRLGVPTVVGGPLVSACFEELRAAGFAPTSIFVGESEELLPVLLEDLSRGALRPAYAHVVDEEGARRVRSSLGSGARVHVGPRPELDSSPVPRFDLLDLRAYHTMAIQTSRGCPIACEFCDIWKQFGRKARVGSTERVVDQLAFLHSLGWRGRVFVVDDNFIGNAGAARQLLERLEEWQEGPKRFTVPAAYSRSIGPRRMGTLRRRFRRRERDRRPFAFSTEADVRVGLPGPRMSALREAMVRAGFGSVFLGIETPSAGSLNEAGKKVNLGREGDPAGHLLASVERIQRAGLEPMSGFILGFDNDPPDVDLAMSRFVSQAAIPMAMVGLLGVLPGTDLHTRLSREGRYHGRLDGAQTHGFALNYEPVGRSEAEIVDGYANVLRALYGGRMESYYARCEASMDRMPVPPSTGDRVGWREIRAFLASLFLIRPRRSYWSFLLRCLRHRKAFFAYAVVLAMQGEHLHRLTVEWLAERAQQLRGRSEAAALTREPHAARRRAA